MPRRSAVFTSSEIANATAHSPARPASSTPRLASPMPRRATSIQWPVSGVPGPERSPSSGADRIAQVFVERTWQPVSA